MLLTPDLKTDLSDCPADLQALINDAVRVITQAISNYGTENVAIAFNGGKDCTVLLHLLYIALQKLELCQPIRFLAVCIETDSIFPEQEKFIAASAELYKVSLLRISGKIKDALFELQTRMPHIKAVLMGTRSTDPYSASLLPFTPCDAGWPDLMRVSPILDWRYCDVWRFVKELSIPYCTLYDAGYTSLGNIHNTSPNPALLQQDGVTYSPAYSLDNGGMERAGRA